MSSNSLSLGVCVCVCVRARARVCDRERQTKRESTAVISFSTVTKNVEENIII